MCPRWQRAERRASPGLRARRGAALWAARRRPWNSWSARLLGRHTTDADKVSLSAAWTEVTGPGAVGGRVGCGPDRFGRARGCRAPELKQKPDAGRLLAPAMVPKPEVADLVQALGQDVLQEPTHELVAGHTAGPPSVGSAMLVTDGHGLVVEGDHAGVADGDPEHVAGEIVEHGLLALTPDGAVDDPGLGPSRGGQDQAGAAFGQGSSELAAYELGERPDRHEELDRKAQPCENVR